MITPYEIPDLVRNVGQQCHESGAFDGYRNGMLTNGGATALSAVQDFSLPTRQFFEQFDIFVIDEHRTGTLSTYHKRVLFRNLNSRFGTFTLLEFGLFGKGRHSIASEWTDKSSGYSTPFQQ